MGQHKKNQKDKSQMDAGVLKKKDIPKNPDPGVDRDFPGFPHATAHENVIRPVTKKENEIADTSNKDGEKRSHKTTTREDLTDDGSANAFERTELAGDDNE
jgi:hypothetical protein